jgi:hypothetical protein
MIYKYLLLLLLRGYGQMAFAQHLLHGRVEFTSLSEPINGTIRRPTDGIAGTLSDNSGNFFIKITNDTAGIVVNCIGYKRLPYGQKGLWDAEG